MLYIFLIEPGPGAIELQLLVLFNDPKVTLKISSSSEKFASDEPKFDWVHEFVIVGAEQLRLIVKLPVVFDEGL